MKKLITILQPLSRKQRFYIYENGNLVHEEECTTENIENTIFSLVDKYSIEKIQLGGPKQYNRGIKRKIQEAEVSKYNKNVLEIDIL